jgi:putative membrane protein
MREAATEVRPGRFGRPGWLNEGQDPDYRFSLANERTFLAWIRTSLALLAGAVAVAQFLPPFTMAGSRTALAGVLALTGFGVAGTAYRRWARTERAMRNQQSLPHTSSVAVLATSLSIIAMGVLLLVALEVR